MSKPVPIIGKSAGLNTIFDPFQPVEDIDFLAKAVGIRITDSGIIERAEPARRLVDLVGGHSLFCDGGACLVHQGGAMFEVAADLTLSAAKRTGMSGEKVDHAQYGEAILFGNRQENGNYYRGATLSWLLDVYTGAPTDRIFADPVPLFDHIATFNGHVLGSIDNALFASERGKPGLWDTEPVWMTDTRITMIKPVVTDAMPVSGGVFVSDEKRQVFLGGLDPREFAEPRIASYPAIEWSVAHGLLDASAFSELTGLVGVWQSARGLCLGFPTGQIINATQKVIKMPEGYTSGATLIAGSNIISTLR